MQRRAWLRVAAAASLSACMRAPSPGSRSRVQAVAFDLFTLFDPTTIDRRVAAVVGDGTALAVTWKTRAFATSWQLAAARRYVPFDRVVADALHYACRVHHVDLTAADRARLAAGFTELDAWPDTHRVLHALRDRGLRLATLANFSPAMIDSLLARAGLTALFDARISTDEARTYKPDPHAYVLAERRFGVQRTQVAFAAFGAWDADGAAAFGLPTFWVNRSGDTDEPAVPSGRDLGDLERWLSDR